MGWRRRRRLQRFLPSRPPLSLTVSAYVKKKKNCCLVWGGKKGEEMQEWMCSATRLSGRGRGAGKVFPLIRDSHTSKQECFVSPCLDFHLVGFDCTTSVASPPLPPPPKNGASRRKRSEFILSSLFSGKRAASFLSLLLSLSLSCLMRGKKALWDVWVGGRCGDANGRFLPFLGGSGREGGEESNFQRCFMQAPKPFYLIPHKLYFFLQQISEYRLRILVSEFLRVTTHN